jgi:ubiquinone/menaquinone biosynthesis C-methylase UbiE
MVSLQIGGENVDSVVSSLRFRGMSLFFRLRDLALPRAEILSEVSIKAGAKLLDYGCGPGGYVPTASELVGKRGKVYALDIHPLAITRVQQIAAREHLVNVEAIHSGCKTGLPDASLDVVLLYDVFHALDNPQAILAELHRVLKPSGTLSFSDHHMAEAEIISGVTDGQLFHPVGRGQHTYTFAKRT